jgi:deoxycytidylate deaminase
MISLSTLLKLAEETASKSEHNQRHGAVIFDKNIIISTGYNVASGSASKLHPRFCRWQYSIHAETACILNAKTDLKGCSMLIIRLNKANELMNSRPCNWCYSYLNYVGIKKIIYSNKEGELVWEKL